MIPIRAILFACLLCVFTSVFSQNRLLSFGVEVTPAYTDWRIQNVNGYENMIVYLEEQEQGNFGGAISAFINASSESRFESSLGIGYHRGGIRTKKLTDFVTPGGPDPSIPESVWSVVKTHSLIIPYRLKFKITPGFYVRAGFEPSYIFAMPTVFYAQYADQLIKTKSDEYPDYIRSLNVNANFGLGYQFSIANDMRGYVEPCINMSILGLSKEYIINRYPFYLGMTFGFEIM